MTAPRQLPIDQRPVQVGFNIVECRNYWCNSLRQQQVTLNLLSRQTLQAEQEGIIEQCLGAKLYK